MEKEQIKILDKWAALRFLTCRKILGFKSSLQSSLSIKSYLQRCLELSHRQGGFFYRLDGDRLVFVISGFCYYDAHLQTNVNRILFDCVSSPEIKADFQRFLPKISKQFGADFSLEVLEPYSKNLPIFRALGLGIKAQQYGGYTDISERLLKKHIQLSSKKGMMIRELSDDSHLDWVWNFKSRSFDAQPDLAWYWEKSDRQKDFEICLLKQTVEKGRAFSIESEGVPIAYLGYLLSDGNDSWPRFANVDMIVDADWRGRGLLGILYEKLFAELRREKVAYFRGMSSNPAVLHYATKLLRPRISHLLAPLKQCPEQKRFVV